MLTQDNYYRDKEYLSNTMMSYVTKSPNHFKAFMDNTLGEQTKFSFGTQYHMAVLEPEKFERSFVQKPKGLRKGTKEYDMLNQMDDRVLLDYSDWELIMNMRETLYAHYRNMILLPENVIEHIAIWQDDGGILCKKKMDIWSGDTIIDLKSTSSSDWVTTAKDVYHYDRQAAFYLEDGKAHDFMFIVQEKSYPYIPVIYECTSQFIQQGVCKVMEAKKKYIQYKSESLLIDKTVLI